MFRKIKRFFYFPIASYFALFAAIRLKLWRPRIIVITGSSGKTTLLHLIESQLGDNAKYTHKANSSFGIPFNILGLQRNDLTLIEWPLLFIQAPFALFKNLPKEKIYIVEADCDRSGEGKFLTSFIKPEITLWLNVSKSHSGNFKSGSFSSVDEAIAYEFGYFAEKTTKLVIANTDSKVLVDQLKRVNCEVKEVSGKDLTKYEITLDETHYQINNENYTFKYLLPKEMSVSILMCKELVDHLNLKFDKSFSNFNLPNGRSSIFRGVKNTTIVDSTYNATLESMKAIINMFAKIQAKNKWIVLGDMIELGQLEKSEHEKLSEVINNFNFDKVIFMGPRVSNYTLPLIKKSISTEHFLYPNEVLNYLKHNIKGGETILFKGVRFLEGVIENLLENKFDSKYLVRREKVWDIRRKKFGL